MMNVDDPYVAYCLDSAVATFGLSLEAELDSVEGKNAKEIAKKRNRILDRWLGNPVQYRQPPVSKGRVDAPAEPKEIETEFSATGVD